MKPTKADEAMKSASSDPSSDKRSDDDDDAEEEKVHLHTVMHTAAQYFWTNLVWKHLSYEWKWMVDSRWFHQAC